MTRAEIEELIYGKPEQQRRFTQDFPILPDVWIAYAEPPNKRQLVPGKSGKVTTDRIGLLLTPHSRCDASTAARALRERLKDEQPGLLRYRKLHPSKLDTSFQPRIIFNEAVIFADFTFEELLRVAMPLTDWWKSNVANAAIDATWTADSICEFVARLETGATSNRKGKSKSIGGDPRLLKKLITIVGAIECDRYEKPYEKSYSEKQPINKEQASAFADLLEGLTAPREKRGFLYGVSRNRPANSNIWRSRMAVKADAAIRLFEVDTSGIRWAVFDVGIDARHPAFARRKDGKIRKKELDDDGNEQFASRIVRTYDFLRIKDLLNPATEVPWQGSYVELLDKQSRDQRVKDLRKHLKSGRATDWDLLEPFLRIPHRNGQYDKYQAIIGDSHGTHVAGIIAANWPEAKKRTPLDQKLYGICPDLEIYDLRVLGTDAQGQPADEFSIIAALQFIRHMNANRDLMAIHGVNLSMAVAHDVANYACGRTPICEECERAVANGIVVVSAAGNRGFNKLANLSDGAEGDYRYISITDPGNAENVITVGSTHRFMPHNYGVSYFSSRGPTGDGRTKPDLVAPGEKIDSCGRNDGFETMDGTSMAAPHVSGAAALLIARHRELIGQPKRVKEILLKSATDLGREPRFQGAGMLDVLRALQSV